METISVDDLSATIGYNSTLAFVYLFVLHVVVSLSFLAHAVFFYLVIFYTPKEMFNFRITVCNTTVWSFLFLVTFGILLQPVPLFPAPAAIVNGPLRLLGDWGAQLGWQTGAVCVSNYLAASMNCLAVIAYFLIRPKGLLSSISRRQGLAMGIGLHLIASAAVIFFFNAIYKPMQQNAKIKVSSVFPELNDALHLSSNNASSAAGIVAIIAYDPTTGPHFLAQLLICFTATLIAIVLAIYGLLVRKIYATIRKSSTEETNRSRRNVLKMLSVRIFCPLTFGFLPVLLLSASLQFNLHNSFGLNCCLCAVGITHGFQNIISTIIAYQPYRQRVARFLLRFMDKCGIGSEKCRNCLVINNATSRPIFSTQHAMTNITHFRARSATAPFAMKTQQTPNF